MKKTLLLILFCWATFVVMGQRNVGVESLKRNYPKLWAQYGAQFDNLRSDYYFAVDVSGGMHKYKDVVRPALNEFFSALQEGDDVTLIRFGTKAKVGMGATGTISPKLRQGLSQAVSKMYDRDNSLFYHTNISEMTKELTEQMRMGKHELQFVFIITDYLNDVENGGEQLLSSAQLAEMAKDFNAACVGKDVHIVALKLPKLGSGKGFCLEQLENTLPAEIRADRYQMVEVANEAALTGWFNNLKRKIMDRNFRAFIMKKNREVAPQIKNQVDIDGNVVCDIQWTPSELYNTLVVDSLALTSEAYTMRGQERLEFDGAVDDRFALGQIRHKTWNYAPCRLSIEPQFSLPTSFDDELTRLKIMKPVPQVAIDVDRNIFTFLFSFKTTCVLAGLLLLYILGVIRAMIRNMKSQCELNVKVKDARTFTVLHDVKRQKLSTGKTLRVPISEANCVLKYKKANPWLVVKKPYLTFVEARNAQGAKVRNLKNMKKVITKNRRKLGPFYVPDKRNANFSFEVEAKKIK